MIKFKKFYFFLICGFVASFVNFVSRIYLNQFILISLNLSIIFSHLLGMIIAFVLFKFFVFESTKKISKSLFYFILVNFLSLLIIFISTYISIKIFEYFLFINDLIITFSHGIALIITAFTSFFLHKKFTY